MTYFIIGLFIGFVLGFMLGERREHELWRDAICGRERIYRADRKEKESNG